MAALRRSSSEGGYFPAGTGWYRKTFSAPPEWKGKRVGVEFDGVYRDATVYLNGHKLGNQPYGYTSFRFDLTPDLDFSGPNVLAVRVDNSAQPNSRWYTGSGIYRHVRVLVTEPVHVAHWGIAITTARVVTRAPPATSITYGMRSHVSRDAPFAINTSAPNFCACVYARPASSCPEMPVGNPR